MFENRIGDTKVLFPVIFPASMVHADIGALRRHMPGWHHQGVVPVSAGMIDSITVTNLHGESETLSLESKPSDASIIDSYAYSHGIL